MNYQILSPASLRIEISSNNLSESPQNLRREQFKPIITAEVKSSILQHCFRLKAENVRYYKSEAVKLFYKENYSEEYKNFEKYDDWKKCPITGKMVYRWEKNFNHARSEQKIKFDEEKNQFLLNPPAAFQISNEQQNEIILEGIKLEGTSKQPRLGSFYLGQPTLVMTIMRKPKTKIYYIFYQGGTNILSQSGRIKRN
jgi:hypothetical protein